MFAVIAAAVIAVLNPPPDKRKKYIAATGHILKAVAPAVVKGAGNLLLKTIGLDSDDVSETIEHVKDAVVDESVKFSERAIERLLESYSMTKELQEDFQNSLNDMTKGLERPFVIIIDELDRCRPAFALEVLERIKHLFSADNVVFVLFWNSESIHESIRHTYGRNTHAEAYLSKFLALSIPLPLPYRGDIGPSSKYSSFIEREMTRTCPNAYDREEFQRALADIAGVFNASLRDVQKAIGLFKLGDGKNPNLTGTEFAYCALLKVTNEGRYTRLLNGDENVARDEAMRFPVPSFSNRPQLIEQLWAVLMYLSDPDKYSELVGTGVHGQNEADDFVVATLGLGKPASREKWLIQSGRFIDAMLTTTRYAKQKS